MYMSLCRHSHTSEHVFLTNRAVKGISADTDKSAKKGARYSQQKSGRNRTVNEIKAAFGLSVLKKAWN